MPQKYAKQQKANVKKIILLISTLILIPLALAVSILNLKTQGIYISSILIIFYVIFIFFASFEHRSPQAKEVVIIAVMSAIAIAGRSAFFFVPQFKPMIAIVIVTGVCLGAESGFLTGAVSAFVSNFFFGQGPWTPWQMFATGIIGFLAGIIFKKGKIKPSKLNLCIFGALSTLIIYGGLLNLSTFFMAGTVIAANSFLAVWATGISFDLIHVAATIIFLFLISHPMLEKLTRIKLKYGFME